jgi:hypothetical protein
MRMPVTPRSLRRNAGFVRVGAGVVAGAVGMTTAAFGLLHVVQPYKGNGAVSGSGQSADPGPTSPTQDLTDAVLAMAPAEVPVDDTVGETLAMSLPTDSVVTAVVDTIKSQTGGNSSSGGGSNAGDGSGGGGLVLNPGINQPNLGGGSGGDEGSKGLETPDVNITPPDVLPESSCDSVLPAALVPAFGQPAEEQPADGTTAEEDQSTSSCDSGQTEEPPAEEQPPADGGTAA